MRSRSSSIELLSISGLVLVCLNCDTGSDSLGTVLLLLVLALLLQYVLRRQL